MNKEEQKTNNLPKDQKEKSTNNWKNTSAFVISLIAISFSAYIFWDSTFNSSTEVHVGKHVKLFVATFDTLPQRPLIIASLSCINYGGRAKAIIDSKLQIRIFSDEKQTATAEFFSLREFDNLLEVEGDSKRAPITPILVLGKSMATRQIGYVSEESWIIPDLSESFRIEFDLFVKYTGSNWENMGTYEIDKVSGIWQDLNSDTTYQFRICLANRLF